jgi:excisionase family DNA binding protein
MRHRVRAGELTVAASGPDLPFLVTVGETAALLRTSRKAVYSMIERRQLPGVTRIGRRVLIRTPDLLNWLRQKSTPSLER